MRTRTAPPSSHHCPSRLHLELLEDRRVLAGLGGLTQLPLVSVLSHDVPALLASVHPTTQVQAASEQAPTTPRQSAAAGRAAALVTRLEVVVSEVLQPALQGIEDAALILGDGGADQPSPVGQPPPGLAPVASGDGGLTLPGSILDIPVVVPVLVQPRPGDEGAGDAHAGPGLLEVAAQAADSAPPPAAPAVVDVTVRLAPDAAQLPAARPVAATASGSLTLEAPADGQTTALSDGPDAQAARAVAPIGLMSWNASALVHAETVAALPNHPGALNMVLREVEHMDRAAREEPMPLAEMDRLALDAAQLPAARPVVATASGSLTLESAADGQTPALSDGPDAQAARAVVPIGLMSWNASALVHAETVAALPNHPGALNMVLREVEHMDRAAREEPMPLAEMDRHALTAVIEHEGHAVVLDRTVPPPALAVPTRSEPVIEAEAPTSTPPLAAARAEDGETAWGWLTCLSSAPDNHPAVGGRINTVEAREVPAIPATTQAAADVTPAGLASGALLADADALRQAVQEFLGQLDAAGRDLTSAMTDNPWALWLAAAAVAAVAAEGARRRLRRLAASGTPAEWAEDGTLSWHSDFHPFRSAEA